LPYVAQQAVEHFNWLDPGQMMVGLGLAETTPGPLIMVLEFVGFTGAWQHPGALPPLLAATFGALVTVWATFMPSFALVFAGAPWIERMGRVATWRHALAAISAAVLGVIANLALWFGAHAALRGDRIDWNVPLLALLLWLLLQRFRPSVPLIVLLGAALGALLP
jgi:chromate transporter